VTLFVLISCACCGAEFSTRSAEPAKTCSKRCRIQQRTNTVLVERRAVEQLKALAQQAPEGARWLAIRSTSGYVFSLVDEDIFEHVSILSWQLHSERYAGVKHRRKSWVFLHHLIIGAPPDGLMIDHRNRDTLDNRRANLRFASRAQNMQNRQHWVGFRGVDQTGPNSWRAAIRADGRRISLGSFATAEAAARAYDEAAVKYHGEFAQLNFKKELT
jgi:hypothetical protein